MGTVGGLQNQLQYSLNNITTSIQNFTSSASTIEDVNMATEVSNFTKNQILQQSAMAMLAQANAEPQNVLKLLQTI
jgi:flagellin